MLRECLKVTDEQIDSIEWILVRVFDLNGFASMLLRKLPLPFGAASSIGYESVEAIQYAPGIQRQRDLAEIHHVGKILR
jgi:hypothetical protein